MELQICVPSLNRREKLNNCLNSIFISSKNIPLINLNIFLGTQADYDYFAKCFYGIENIKVRLLEHYRVPDFWSNHLRTCHSDGMMFCNDDLLFYEDSIVTMIQEYTTQFPTYDGLMGIHQTNITSSNKLPGAFCIVGMKFADRFPNRQIMAPEYYRLYADHELWLYAKSINKFYFSSISQIQHLHPCTDKKLIDNTHLDVRKYLQQDKLTFEERQRRGYLWGQDFNTITERKI